MAGETCPDRGRLICVIWPSLQIGAQENGILDLLAELGGEWQWEECSATESWKRCAGKS